MYHDADGKLTPEGMKAIHAEGGSFYHPKTGEVIRPGMPLPTLDEIVGDDPESIARAEDALEAEEAALEARRKRIAEAKKSAAEKAKSEAEKAKSEAAKKAGK